MDLNQAKEAFELLLHSVRPGATRQFIAWLEDRIEDEQLMMEKEWSRQDKILDSIREDIRGKLPLTAMSDTETIHIPQYKNLNPKTTVHVDAFLYDDDFVERLCEEGKMSRNVCTQCGSHDTQPLTLLTHSASITQIKYIFLHVLPSLQGRKFVDIGSRTGAILYGAYLYSACSQIIGVEMDISFCHLQQHIVSSYNFQDRIKIVHDDVLNQLNMIKNCDVLVLNNVFEFFLTSEQQVHVWKQLFTVLRKPGTLLVTVPSIEESLEHLETGIDVMKWLRPVDLSDKLEEARILLKKTDDADELDKIYLYQVAARSQNKKEL
ncbi:uncharacterized protein LOC112570870 [Pomacea canaliculata]|uniref:uncharacterized protein LOC112570870 n=1 Tax=Pomacea canaliculata TaxID=400727 RepID=UPI000D737ECE|nr:uncharacterized protein LOC112570870 [Pomacea canaliculata]